MSTPSSQPSSLRSLCNAHIFLAVVGAVTPSIAPWVFGIICFVAAAVQILGFIGVARVSPFCPYCSLKIHPRLQEKSILFRRYVSLHSLTLAAAFSVSLVWIILSLSHHSTAKSNCLSNFFAHADDKQITEGNTLCEIFPWVDVGVMGGLWLILAILHVRILLLVFNNLTDHTPDLPLCCHIGIQLRATAGPCPVWCPQRINYFSEREHRHE